MLALALLASPLPATFVLTLAAASAFCPAFLANAGDPAEDQDDCRDPEAVVDGEPDAKLEELVESKIASFGEASFLVEK